LEDEEMLQNFEHMGKQLESFKIQMEPRTRMTLRMANQIRENSWRRRPSAERGISAMKNLKDIESIGISDSAIQGIDLACTYGQERWP